MKFLFILLILSLSSLAMAMPYRCTSIEEVNGAPVVTYKINPQVNRVEQDGTTWSYWRLGVSPTGKNRLILYGQGTVSETRISMTFVRQQTVIGYMSAEDRGEENVLEGEFKNWEVAGNKVLNVRCLKITE